MVNGYSLGLNDRSGFLYSKTHKNGAKTEVQGDKVGTQATGGTSWLVNIKDPNGNSRLGRYDTKREAERAAKSWMRNHPKGVEGQSGGLFGGTAKNTQDAMSEATNNIFTGGGRF